MENERYNHAVIVAGGSGTRLNNKVPKQYVDINGVPIIIHTLRTFMDLDIVNIIVVIPENNTPLFEDLCKSHSIDMRRITTVIGGKKRFYSVKNALDFLEYKIKINPKSNNHFIAIHDAARPLVTKETIIKSYKIAYSKGSAIASIPMTSSLRQVTLDKSKSVDRSNYKIINTPQTFRFDWLLKAYGQPHKDIFTDDASVVENAGYDITLYEDFASNIKVTYPEDLLVAKALIKNKDEK